MGWDPGDVEECAEGEEVPCHFFGFEGKGKGNQSVNALPLGCANNTWHTRKACGCYSYRVEAITLLRSITMLCVIDNIMWNILHVYLDVTSRGQGQEPKFKG